LFAPAQPPQLEDHPYRLYAIAYSIHSQLPSISGGRLIHPQPLDTLPHSDRYPRNVEMGEWRYSSTHSLPRR